MHAQTNLHFASVRAQITLFDISNQQLHALVVLLHVDRGRILFVIVQLNYSLEPFGRLEWRRCLE
jgi:hypothetical protein